MKPRIKKFCSTKFHVTFPMFAKVKTHGEGQSPIYKLLAAKGEPKWNFHKYLIGKDGQVLAAFPSNTLDSPELRSAIDAAPTRRGGTFPSPRAAEPREPSPAARFSREAQRLRTALSSGRRRRLRFALAVALLHEGLEGCDGGGDHRARARRGFGVLIAREHQQPDLRPELQPCISG